MVEDGIILSSRDNKDAYDTYRKKIGGLFSEEKNDQLLH